MSTLAALWNEAEHDQPDKVAMITPAERLTYRQLGERIRRLSSALVGRWSVGRGDVVALLAPNCAEFVISYFAVVQLGAIVQPVDERLSSQEMWDVLADSRPSGLIVHRALWPKYEAIRADLPGSGRLLGIDLSDGGIVRFEEWIAGSSGLRSGSWAGPGDVAELMYTSGTTGRPKGVMRTHTNVRAAARNSIRGFGYRADDVIAIVMPLSHSSALNSQMMPLIQLGGTLVLLPRFDAGDLISAIRAEGVTCMRAVPTMLRALLAVPGFRAEVLPSLRMLVNSSAPIDPQTYAELKQRFAKIELMNSYGLTEASTCTVLPDAMALVRPDSVGHAIRGVEMCVLDDEGRVLPDGAEGEIAVRGEHVFAGYRGMPEATSARFVNGWLLTGDVGRRDSDGYYVLHGRKDDVINSGGHKVAPLEIEHCILQLPEVAEVAVVGRPHRILGQVAKAFVVARDGEPIDSRAITRHCARSLASHKVPFYVEVVPELPKSGVGKILRRKLRESVND